MAQTDLARVPHSSGASYIDCKTARLGYADAKGGWIPEMLLPVSKTIVQMQIGS